MSRAHFPQNKLLLKPVQISAFLESVVSERILTHQKNRKISQKNSLRRTVHINRLWYLWEHMTSYSLEFYFITQNIMYFSSLKLQLFLPKFNLKMQRYKRYLYDYFRRANISYGLFQFNAVSYKYSLSLLLFILLFSS